MIRRRGLRGMSLVEVAMALCLLSLTAVFLIGAITVLTRRDVTRVNNLARANAYATRYLETQRSSIRGSSLIDPLSDVNENIAGTIFNAQVTLRLGTIATAEVVSKLPSVALGSFVAFIGPYTTDAVTGELKDSHAAALVVRDAAGNPVPSSAVRVTVTITWTENGSQRQVVRQDILAPRKV